MVLDDIDGYDLLKAHRGHKLEIQPLSREGKREMLCLDCVDCDETLMQFENYESNQDFHVVIHTYPESWYRLGQLDRDNHDGHLYFEQYGFRNTVIEDPGGAKEAIVAIMRASNGEEAERRVAEVLNQERIRFQYLEVRS